MTVNGTRNLGYLWDSLGRGLQPLLESPEIALKNRFVGVTIAPFRLLRFLWRVSWKDSQGTEQAFSIPVRRRPGNSGGTPMEFWWIPLPTEELQVASLTHSA